MKRYLLVLVCFLGFMLPGAAWAQVCEASMSDMVFSGDPAGSDLLRANMTGNVSCRGGMGRVGRILFCADLNQGSAGGTPAARLMSNGNHTLEYALFNEDGTVSGSPTFGSPASDRTFNYFSFTGFAGRGELSFNINGFVASGQPAVIGRYSSTFSAADASFRWRWDDGLGCRDPSGTVMSVNPFTISLEVASNCNVTTTSVDFGSHGSLAQGANAQGAVNVTCTGGTTYNVLLDAGKATASSSTRKMFKDGDPSLESIDYNLFEQDGSVWGDTPLTFLDAQTGNGFMQVFTVYGKVPAQKTMPSAGTYSDSVKVIIAY